MRQVILGLGKTGIALARHFKKRRESIHIMDTRSQPPYLKEWLATADESDRLTLGDFNWDLIESHSTCWVSPGIRPDLIPLEQLRRRSVVIKSDIDILMTQTNRPLIIAVTGSNGKSTVVDIINVLFERNGYSSCIAGNHNYPAVSLLESKVDVWILELSSFQLFYSNGFYADVGVLLNITEDHLDWHKTMRHYTTCKLKCIKESNHAIIYHPLLAQYNDNNTTVISFDVNQPRADWTSTNEAIYYNDRLIVSSIKGQTHQLNHMAAFAAVTQVIKNPSYMVHEKKLPFRQTFMGKINNRYWYNDSKSTNLSSMASALGFLYEQHPNLRVVLILGGVSKSRQQPEFNCNLFKAVRFVAIYGQSAQQINRWASTFCQTEVVENLHEATQVACEKSSTNDVVLFSPACASFDQYHSYFERGQHFQELVMSMHDAVST